MCVIAAKPAGVAMPTDQEIKNMWYRNDDGAGMMYAYHGKVYIEKGYMDLDKLTSRLEVLDALYGLKSLSMVLHFRITTHGGTKPECTHPFPISESMGKLKKLTQKTNIGVAHNGVIPGCSGGKDYSDTMEYIAEQLAPLYKAVPKFYENKNLMQMIRAATASKLAFLTGDGAIYTVGKFEEHNGIMYSNSSYEHMNSWRDYDYSKWGGYCGSGGWLTEKTTGNITAQMRLMWIDETEGQFVTDGKNDMLSGDFAIDRYNYVYEYDYNEDAFICRWNYRAYNSEGMALKFKEEESILELVVY